MRLRAFALCFAFLCLAQPGLAVTRSWTGATSAAWSEATNWSPAGTPAPADTLVFPAGVTRTSMTNDLPAGTSVGPMDFRTSYTLSGNPLTLTGDLTFDQVAYTYFTCNVDLTLGAAVRLGGAITSQYNGSIDVNGQALTIDSYNTSFNGPINGTGTIAVNGSGISIASSGAFNGTMAGNVDVVGSMPNAAISGGLSGNGTVGAATTPYWLYLGSKNPSYSDNPHGIGTLQTQSAAITGPLYVDLTPGGTSDQLQVTGSVTLGGNLYLTVPIGALSAGQSFTIIDNDGTDAVNGTFSSLPEGASISLGTATVVITYQGGNGNDVALTTASSTKSWTGANSGLWSDPGNWSPAAVPAPGEALAFPAGAAHTSMTNDLPAGTSVGPMDFRTSYTLSGNPLTLTGDLTFDQVAYTYFTCNVDLTLGAAVRLGGAITSQYNGSIDVNGQTLTIDSYNTSFHGAINGTGTIAVNGSGISIASSGAFNGTMAGNVDVVGSMPNAAISGGLSGNGTVGAATTPYWLYLGSKNPSYSDNPHGIGTLQTQSATITGPLYVDLIPGGVSDQLQVAGTVTLGGNLYLTVPIGALSAGQSFTIIDNDGADAVNGTFSSLPEGASISFGTATVVITYQGGNGNDVVLTTASSTKSWTGANSGLWSDPGNWSPAAVPAPGEALAFPAGAAHTSMTNDLPAGTSVGPMDFRVSYTLNGNPLTLTGDLTFDQAAYTNFTCNVDLTLGASVRLGGAITSQYNGSIDVNGQTLMIDSYNTSFHGAINGTGAIAVNGSGISIASSGAFNGTMAGNVDVVGSMPNAAISGGLSGNGTVGAATTPYWLYLGSKNPSYSDNPHGIGTLQTQSATIAGPLYVDLIPGGTSDQLQVTGSVTLGGRLSISVPTGSPVAGQTFTIIDNDGTDAVDGTFEGHAEDSIISRPPWTFRITYAGGDGNDVVLTAVDETSTESLQDKAATRVGEPATFTARVTSRVLVPNGTVTFTDNNAVIATLPLVNGAASLQHSLTEPGMHTIAALYEGTSIFAPSTAAVTHQVQRGNTSTALSAPAGSILYGDAAVLSVSVGAVAPATGVPSGNVTLRTNGVSVGTAALAQGGASVPAASFDAGTHSITAAYAGDSRFESSDSAAATLTVLKAPTLVEASSSSTESGLALTIDVRAPHQPALPVGGVVMVSENNAILTQRALDGAPTVITLALPTGRHELVVSYLGSPNFEASSAPVVHTVPPLTYRAAKGLVHANGLTLDLYTPVSGTGPFPLIVWIPGTEHYDAAGSATPALHATGRGYVVANVRYRSANVAPFPAQLVDLQNAIRWLRANAAQYGIDPKRVAVWGSSAGGHLASLLGTMSEETSRVQAVVVWAGASDLLRLQSDGAASSCSTKYDDWASPQSSLLGCALPSCSDKAVAASPMTFVSPDDPPFLIMHGDTDCVVPSAQSSRLHDALRAAGVAATLRMWSGGAPATWTSPEAVREVETFLDGQLKPHRRRRSTR